jgi:hypothetical protein
VRKYEFVTHSYEAQIYTELRSSPGLPGPTGATGATELRVLGLFIVPFRGPLTNPAPVEDRQLADFLLGEYLYLHLY